MVQGSLAAVALAIAFVPTVAVNRWGIVRGLGHARAHSAHAGHRRRLPGVLGCL